MLDDAVDDVHGEALAAVVAEHGHGSGVVQDQAEGLGELAAGVSEEGDVGSGDLHVFGPSAHDGAVVHAVHEDLVDPGSLKAVLPAKVARDLARGSGGGESAGKTNDEGLLAGETLGHGNLGGGTETEVKVHSGEFVADGNHLASFASYGDKRGKERESRGSGSGLETLDTACDKLIGTRR